MRTIGLYWRYPMLSRGLRTIFAMSNQTLRFSGVFIGPIALGIMWRTRADKDEWSVMP